MKTTDYGHFTHYVDANEPNLVPFVNRKGEDWYSLRATLMEWDFEKRALKSAKHARWAMVDPSGVVTNVETDPSRLMPGDRTVLGVDGEGTLEPGMLFTGNQFEPAPVADTVPMEITMRQCRLALLRDGILDEVENAVNTMQGDEGRAARIEWEYASTVRRDSALMQGIAQALSLTDKRVRALFVIAAEI